MHGCATRVKRAAHGLCLFIFDNVRKPYLPPPHIYKKQQFVTALVQYCGSWPPKKELHVHICLNRYNVQTFKVVLIRFGVVTA